jgi:nitrous oxidase accessory protein NosD
MKKTLALAIVFLFLGMSIIPSTAIVNEEKNYPTLKSGNIFYVGGSGPGNYTKIQDAINDSLDGDTVFVYNGIYFENLMIFKRSISLIGEDKHNTIIDGCGGEWTVGIDANNVTVTGFTIMNATKKEIDTGGIVSIGINTTIIGNIIKNNWNGVIFLDQFPFFKGSRIIQNNITDNKFGVFLIFCDFAIIKENNFINNFMNAKFDTARLNRWKNNYWDDYYGILPFKVIFGIFIVKFIPITTINIDFHPAKEPYDI